MADMFTFIGVQGFGTDGTIVTVSAYTPPDGDEIDPAVALEQVKKLAKSMGLTLVTNSNTGNGGAGRTSGDMEIKEVGTVVRRTQKNTKPDGTKTTTPAIELYPVWNATGSYGKWRFATNFLNQEADVTNFENATGLKLAELPVYSGQGAPQRVFGEPEDWEIVLDPPRRAAFTVEKVKNDAGEEKDLLRFHHWISDPA